MLKIALAQASSPFNVYHHSMPPLGIGYLISWCRERVPDCEFRFLSRVEDILDYRPDLVGVSSASENFGDATRMAESVKAALGVPVVVGGMHITALPHSLPKAFDIGVVGEGEITFEEILRLYSAVRGPGPADLAKIKGVVFHEGDSASVTPPREKIQRLDDLPWPARDLVQGDLSSDPARRLHMISSRGCPYDCSFCVSCRYWGGTRFFSPEYVADEIAHLIERHAPLQIHFFDDLMVSNRKRFIRMCQVFEERGLPQAVSFRSHARVNLIDEEIADWFERCRFEAIDFGFESASEKVLRWFNKRDVTPEDNQRAIDILKKRNVSIGASMIIGAGPESPEDALLSLDFIRRNEGVVDRLSAGILEPLPGTPIWEEALRKGLVSESMDWSLLGFNSLPRDKQNADSFVHLSEASTRDEVFRAYLRFRDLEDRINPHGEARFWHNCHAHAARTLESVRRERDALAAELASLKGSRLVRAAQALRRPKEK